MNISIDFFVDLSVFETFTLTFQEQMRGVERLNGNCVDLTVKFRLAARCEVKGITMFASHKSATNE